MRALIVVDVQKDFVEGGALACEYGKQVAADITSYVFRHAWRYDKIVLTRDWHTAGEDNGGHFSETPDYQNTWPAHCVAGSKGAEFADELLLPAGMPVDKAWPLFEIRKGQHMPAYSAFEGVEDNTGRKLEEILTGADAIDVCGIAYDYCVKATVLDARRLLPTAVVTVLADLCANVAMPTTTQAGFEMRKAGAFVRISGVSL